MQKFNAKQYLAIDIANHKGLDKKLWDERIQWVKDNYHNLEQLEPNDKNKFLYRRAVKALRDTDKGLPTNHIMNLDHCNSGAQIMGILGKCKITAENTNLIGFKRNDLYQKIMDGISGVSLDRTSVKEAAIPAFFGSKAEPKALLGGDTPELIAFWGGLYSAAPALRFLSEVFKVVWRSDLEYHSWTLHDGHTTYCPSLSKKSVRVRLEQFNSSFTYEWKEKEPNDNHIPLMVNVVHSIDGYIQREKARRCKSLGISYSHIHDSDWFQCIHGNEVRTITRDIMSELMQMDLLNDIIHQINPNLPYVEWDKEESELWKRVYTEGEYRTS